MANDYHLRHFGYLSLFYNKRELLDIKSYNLKDSIHTNIRF